LYRRVTVTKAITSVDVSCIVSYIEAGIIEAHLFIGIVSKFATEGFETSNLAIVIVISSNEVTPDIKIYCLIWWRSLHIWDK
jgi:hypothetical protein